MAVHKSDRVHKETVDEDKLPPVTNQAPALTTALKNANQLEIYMRASTIRFPEPATTS